MAAGVAILMGACGSDSTPPPNLILITVDTLRADHLSPYGHERDTTPFLSELAAESVLFQDAISQCGTTPQSLSSLMTGLYPYTDELVVKNGLFIYMKPGAPTLAQRLGQAGYRTHGITSSIQSSRATGLDFGFESFDTVEVSPSGDSIRRDAAELTARAGEWLDGVDDERPFFLWLHYFDPHYPYAAPADYGEYFVDSAPTEEGTTAYYDFDEQQSKDYPLTDGELGRLILDYDRELRYLDDSLRDLFEGHLRAHLDDSIVVFTADHGEALGDHGIITHNDLYQTILHVPLLFRTPGARNRGQVVASPVMLVDVYPTVLELLELAPLTPMRGVSLADFVLGEPHADGAGGADGADAKRFRLAEYYEMAVYLGQTKLVLREDSTELYDLERDRSETRNLGQDQPGAQGRLLKKAVRLRRAGPLVSLAEPDALEPATPEMVQELRELGYAGDE